MGWIIENERLTSIMIIIRTGSISKYSFCLVVEKIYNMKERRNENFELYSLYIILTFLLVVNFIGCQRGLIDNL